MQIEQVKIGEIKMYERNAKKHPDKQVEQIVKSIKEFGFNDPIAIDENNVIIEGHGRYLACKKLNIEELPCIRLSHLSDKQKKAYILAHNKLTMNTGYNEELLNLELMDILELNDLDDLDSPINMDDFGFDMTDIVPDDYDEADDEVPDVDGNELGVKKGDIWLLGNHRLMCGDSTSKEDVDKLMNGKKADMLFTDPPYLMGYTGGITTGGRKSFNSKHGAILNDRMTREAGDEFIYKLICRIKDVVRGSYYICFYRLGLEYLYRGLDKAKLQHRALIIWNKMHHTLSNSDYMSKYEPIVYGWVSDHTFYGSKGNFDIWEFERTRKNDLHPTMKPIPLILKAITDSSKKSELVLDLFLGSGSTLIACEKSSRICYGMELDEHYCNVIIKRWEEYTGGRAEKIE